MHGRRRLLIDDQILQFVGWEEPGTTFHQPEDKRARCRESNVDLVKGRWVAGTLIRYCSHRFTTRLLMHRRPGCPDEAT